MSKELYVDGQPLRLGTRIGKGGEGEVFDVNSLPGLALKLYTLSREEKASREAKVEAMIRANLAARSSLVAFPRSIARTRDGVFAGFTMPKVVAHRPLHDLYAPGSRKHKFPKANYRFLVRAASNIARAVASVHSAGCVIGDINHSGILISERATAALIDADSFQYVDGTTAHVCKVGVPEYTPPELQGRSLSNVVRSANHDAFGLAVVIFQLLFMGRHPFIGAVRRGDLPPLHEAIRDFRFAYAEDRDVGMDQPPGTVALSDFSPSVGRIFEKAFARESRDSRPSAHDWVNALDAFENSLTQCEDNSLHHFPDDAAECPWCELEQKLGTILFLPFVANQPVALHPFDPGAAGFNVDELYRQIQNVPCIHRANAKPMLEEGSTVAPSAEATAAKPNDWFIGLLRVAACLAATGILVVEAGLWIVYVPLFWFAVFWDRQRQSSSKEPFIRRYVDVERQWAAAHDDWLRRCGIDELETMQQELRQAVSEYKELANEERKQIAAYNSSRRQRQLFTFLDDFEIRDAKIKGIGKAKELALASYGVETAADVSLEKLLSVPGFGPNNSRGLLYWRQQIERRFVFRESPTDADQQELARITTAINAKASTLRRTLAAGPRNLSMLASRVKTATEARDPVLSRLKAQRDSAIADLNHLGIPLPPVKPLAPSAIGKSASTGVSGSATSRQPSTTASVPTCPRCGSAMVRRTAKRGRRAGSKFWGCSRYPACKATRN